MGVIKDEAVPLVRWELLGTKMVPVCFVIAGAMLLPFHIAGWIIQLAIAEAPLDSTAAGRVAFFAGSHGAQPGVQKGIALMLGVLLDWRWMLGFGFALATRRMVESHEWADAARGRRLSGGQVAASVLLVGLVAAVFFHLWDVVMVAAHAVGSGIPNGWTLAFASPATGEWILETERQRPVWSVVMGECFAQIPAFLTPVLVFLIAHNTMAAPRHFVVGAIACFGAGLAIGAAESATSAAESLRTVLLVAALAAVLAVVTWLYVIATGRRLWGR